MARSRPIPWARWGALALLSTLAVLGMPRAATASGCHVDERPRFGLTSLEGATGAASGPSASDRISPRPCSGESTDPLAADRLMVALDGSTATPAEPPRLGSLPHPIGPRPRPATGWEDRSRPPRSPFA